MRPPALSDALNIWRGLFEPSEKVCKAVFSSLVPLRVEISASESMEETGCPHVASVSPKPNTPTTQVCQNVSLYTQSVIQNMKTQEFRIDISWHLYYHKVSTNRKKQRWRQVHF